MTKRTFWYPEIDESRVEPVKFSNIDPLEALTLLGSGTQENVV
jgi:hypothetical protein